MINPFRPQDSIFGETFVKKKNEPMEEDKELEISKKMLESEYRIEIIPPREEKKS